MWHFPDQVLSMQIQLLTGVSYYFNVVPSTSSIALIAVCAVSFVSSVASVDSTAAKLRFQKAHRSRLRPGAPVQPLPREVKGDLPSCPSLRDVLAETGFSLLRECDWRKSNVPLHASVENRHCSMNDVLRRCGNVDIWGFMGVAKVF